MPLSGLTFERRFEQLIIRVPERLPVWKVISEIARTHEQRPDQFRDRGITLEFGDRELSERELAKLVSALSDRMDIRLARVVSRKADLLHRGFAIAGSSPTAFGAGSRSANGTAGADPGDGEPSAFELPERIESTHTLFLNRTVRAGVKIESPGHVVVLGDVNPGGVVWAGGNVTIFGRLRGVAWAGRPDQDQAFVLAACFEPLQVRVGNYGLTGQDAPSHRIGMASLARVANRGVVVEPLAADPVYRPPRRRERGA